MTRDAAILNTIALVLLPVIVIILLMCMQGPRSRQ